MKESFWNPNCATKLPLSCSRINVDLFELLLLRVINEITTKNKFTTRDKLSKLRQLERYKIMKKSVCREREEKRSMNEEYQSLRRLKNAI